MLRKKLQTVIEVQDVAQHPVLLAEVTRECPNSIRITESSYPIDRYTCLMHVLNFTEKPEYIAIAAYGAGRIYAGTDFAHWLIERGILAEVSQAEAKDGDLVFYFSEGTFKHVGLWRLNGRVLSKWGVGHLYDHDLFEVATSYGTDVRFYKRLPYEDAYDLFTQLAEENDIPFESAEPSSSGDTLLSSPKLNSQN